MNLSSLIGKFFPSQNQSHELPLSIFIFYISLARNFFYESATVVFSGMLNRVFDILTFVLIIKTFVTLIDPGTFESQIEKLEEMLGFNLLMPNMSISATLIVIVIVVVLTNYIVGVVGLKILMRVRRKLQINGPKLNIFDNEYQNRQFSIHHLPDGYESITKIVQICFFFLALIPIVFYLNLLVGAMIALSVPIFTLIVIFHQRRIFQLRLDAQKSKENLGEMDEDEYSESTRKDSKHIYYNRSNTLISNILSGLTLIVIIIAFYSQDQSKQIDTITALFLIFSMRFSLIYARELSVTISQLINQRQHLIYSAIDEVDVRRLKE